MSEPVKKVVFVCTANTCRSPMAEMILKYYLKKEGLTGIKVCSAGLNAYEKDPMNEYAKCALMEMNIPRTVFYSKRVTHNLLKNSIVICMTQNHAYYLKGYDQVYSFFDITGEDIKDPYGENIDAYKKVCLELMEKIHMVKDFIIGKSKEKRK